MQELTFLISKVASLNPSNVYLVDLMELRSSLDPSKTSRIDTETLVVCPMTSFGVQRALEASGSPQPLHFQCPIIQSQTIQHYLSFKSSVSPLWFMLLLRAHENQGTPEFQEQLWLLNPKDIFLLLPSYWTRKNLELDLNQ